MPNSFTSQQLNRLGNALIYLSEGVSEFNKTKILKLLFLLEESSVKLFGHPFFGLDFQVWQYGPVLQDVFIDLSEKEPSLLKDYLKRQYEDEFVGVAKFNDDEFSDDDIYLMDKIIEFARHKNASDLVKYTHSATSLWKKTATKYGLLEDFKNGTKTNSDVTIDFGLLFEENDFLKEKYTSALENNQFINYLKR